MIRALRYLILFLLPFVLYGVWILIARRRALGHENEPNWRDAPLVWLTAAGVVLMLSALFANAILTGEPKGGVYVPPHVEDGQVVPGQVVRPAP